MCNTYKKGTLFMDYLTTKEAASLWNTTEQMIRRYCRDGRISGAVQRDGSWYVPENADKPARKKIAAAPTPKLVKQLQRQRTKKIYHGLFDYMAANGDNYYIDDKAHAMPIPNSAANVAIATGYIDKAFATKELYEFGMFLEKNPLWKAQIQQINVTSAKELELVPQVGDHIIFLGKPGNYENKFDRLKTFYKKGLNEIGWNKYSRISLEFNNQIICTKKEK